MHLTPVLYKLFKWSPCNSLWVTAQYRFDFICLQLSLHQSLLLNTDTVLFSMQERTTYHENEIRQAVQQLEQQFLEFDSSPENLSAENLATVVASATISCKMEEMHDSSKFKYKQVNVSLENDEGVKNLQLPVIVPKEILESSDLVAQVYFSVVNVLWYNFLTFRQVILGSISHHYLSLY